MMTQSNLPEMLFSEAAEKAVVGAMMANPTSIVTAASLQPADFSFDTYRRIFTAVRRLHAEGSSTDELAVVEELKRTHAYDTVGGHVGVMFLTDGLPRNFDVTSQVGIVREKALLRRVANLYEGVVKRAQDGEESRTLLNHLQTAALEHQSSDFDLRPTPIAELVPSFLDRLCEQRDSPGLKGIRRA